MHLKECTTYAQQNRPTGESVTCFLDLTVLKHVGICIPYDVPHACEEVVHESERDGELGDRADGGVTDENHHVGGVATGHRYSSDTRYAYETRIQG